MLFRYLALARKIKPLATSVALFLATGVSAFSEESAQKQESAKKPEAAQERKNILNYRAYRPSESILQFHRNDLSAPAIAAPAVPPPRASRQEQELLDREKNWIFVLPGDENKGSSAEEILGVDESLEARDSKSVITRFLEHKQAPDSKSPNGNAFGRDQNLSANPIFGLDNRTQNSFGTMARPDSLFGNHAPVLSLAERWQELHGARAEKMREEKQVRMTEFENLFNSQSIGTLKNGIDPQTSSSPGAPDFFNRNNQSLSSSLRNPALPIRSANDSALPNINPRVFGSSTAPVITPEPPRRTPPPAVLSIPKRHF